MTGETVVVTAGADAAPAAEGAAVAEGAAAVAQVAQAAADAARADEAREAAQERDLATLWTEVDKLRFGGVVTRDEHNAALERIGTLEGAMTDLTGTLDALATADAAEAAAEGAAEAGVGEPPPEPDLPIRRRKYT